MKTYKVFFKEQDRYGVHFAPAYSEQEAIDLLKVVLPNAQVLKIEVGCSKVVDNLRSNSQK